MTSRLKFLLPLSILVALANLVWLGCGVKSMPIPPEAARPEKILDLEAASAKNGIRLTWSRPESYAGGQKMRDLAEFTVSRADADGKFRKVIDIPVTDQGRFQPERSFTFMDNATEMGKTYRYRVASSTSDGYVSESSNTVTVVRKIPPPLARPEDFVLPTPTPLP